MSSNLLSSGWSILFSISLAVLAPLAAQQPPKPVPAPRINPPGPGEVYVRAVHQEVEGPVRRLKGAAEIETPEVLLRADSIEYNERTGEAVAEGHVRFRNFVSGEELEAVRVEYNVREKTGKFYQVRGKAIAKVEPRRGLLITSNPFVFQGKWAERLKDRYILHHGFLTDCRLPKPIWTLRAPKFDIIPNDRALAYKSTFRIRGIPLLYAPVFYKSLKRQPRKSGFLTPNIGNSSRRGFMLGAGYYWAMSRSYDLAYRAQYFSQRGFAHHINARGRPTQGSEFDAYLYGVADRGRTIGGGRRLKASGFLATVTGKADLGRGFTSRWDINYLSSFLFRQEFTESFNEAVFSEVQSVGYVTRNWSHYGLDFVFRRIENFNSTREGDKIAIRKLPFVRFNMRDRQIHRKVLPVWVSLDTSFGLLRRNQPAFQTRKFVARTDLMPRVMTAIRWKGFHLVPAVAVRGTHWDSSWKDGKISGDGVVRTTGEFTLDFRLPSVARVFDGPQWLGDKVKHVIETRAGFRYVTGIHDFSRFILFDETDLLSNTNEIDYSITNRLYAKRAGLVHEVLTWDLWQARYLDPDFGGAVTPGRRNVLQSSLRLTGYAFLDGPRRYSPVISSLRVSPRPGWGITWRADYDPLRGRFSNSEIMADVRLRRKYFVSLGHSRIYSSPVLSPRANQIRGLVVVGQPNKRGWNAAFSAIYDFRQEVMRFATTQVTYNFGCCGISFQYRRFGFGTRQENQFRVAFAIANIGTFGTLKKQERLF